MARDISELRPKAQAAYAASPELRAARAAQTAPAAAPAAPEGPDIALPSLPAPGDIPGANAGEKALLVAGILIIGLGVFSRVTGKAINLGLTGFTGTAPGGQPSQPPATVANAPLAPAMASRVAAAVPAKAGA